MTNILFNSSVNERISKLLQLVQGTLKEPHRYGQIRNAELKLQIYAK